MNALKTLVLALLLATEASPNVHQWLEATDAARNAFEEAVISARATQIENGKVSGTADFEVYVKGRDRGLIVFRGGKNSGRKILTRGEKMWLIVPGATNAVPITPNQRLMGGASVGDIARLAWRRTRALMRPPRRPREVSRESSSAER